MNEAIADVSFDDLYIKQRVSISWELNRAYLFVGSNTPKAQLWISIWEIRHLGKERVKEEMKKIFPLAFISFQ